MGAQIKKLAIVTTHPIQYYAPIFKLLTERKKIAVKVFYTWEKGAQEYDKDFGKKIVWDLPLLEGYDYNYVSNNGNKKRGFFDLKNPSLNKEIEQWGADAVLVHGWNYYSHLKAMRHFKGRIPVYFRGDSNLIDETSGIKKTLRRLFLTWVYRFVDTAFYVGKNNKQYYLAHGVNEKKLVFVPHAIDNFRFGLTDIAVKKDYRQQLGINYDDVVFLFTGKLEEKKAPVFLIKTFCLLNQKNCHLVLVGNGALETAAKEAAKDSSNIHFIDFQNQTLIPGLYTMADVFVLPSKGPGETWGLSVNEAMACRKAVLVSDKVGCAVDLVMDGKNGYVFKSGDEADLLSKLTLLTNNKNNLEEMGLVSLQIIGHWSFESICVQIENQPALKSN